MKKYNLFLLASILSVILLGFNVKAVNASDFGCTAAGPYNTQTGQFCSTATVPVACPAGDLFSSVTGQPCTTTITSTPSQGDNNNGLDNGLKVGSRGDSVKTLQQTLKNAGFLSGKIDGIYGKLTSAAVQKWYQIYACPVANSASGVNSNCTLISSTPANTFKGPITVVSPNGGETWVKGTTQNITWQDSGILPTPSNCPAGTTNCNGVIDPLVTYYDIQLTPSYTPCVVGQVCPMTDTSSMMYRSPYTIAKNVHGTSYAWNVGQVISMLANSVNNPAPDGSYLVQVCRTGTNVCDSSNASFSVTSGNTIPSTITVVSPNGGETWIKGTNQNITWQDSTILPPCVYGSTACLAPAHYDIQLIPYYAPCTDKVCPMYLYRMPYDIAKNLSSTSYVWSVGQTLENTANPVLSDGSYTVQVCKTGTNVCDVSNAPFSIVSEKAN